MNGCSDIKSALYNIHCLEFFACVGLTVIFILQTTWFLHFIDLRWNFRRSRKCLRHEARPTLRNLGVQNYHKWIINQRTWSLAKGFVFLSAGMMMKLAEPGFEVDFATAVFRFIDLCQVLIWMQAETSHLKLGGHDPAPQGSKYSGERNIKPLAVYQVFWFRDLYHLDGMVASAYQSFDWTQHTTWKLTDSVLVWGNFLASGTMYNNPWCWKCVKKLIWGQRLNRQKVFTANFQHF